MEKLNAVKRCLNPNARPITQVTYYDASLVLSVSSDIPHPYKKQVLDFFERSEYSKMTHIGPGAETDVVDGVTLFGMPVCKYLDGGFEWTTADIFYFERYNIPLDPDFIAYVLTH